MPKNSAQKPKMAYDYSELAALCKDWATRVQAAGWLEENELAAIHDTDGRTPDSLLASADERPLIAAFMGGTGVGKSSLLNRLARQEIARVGIERPTSHEITLYHHHSLRLGQLPEALPLEKVKIAEHSEESNRDIVWIDMPDFDSTELANKDLVMQCLPHIDVLIYVVSPERYRDHKAWQLLLAEKQKHGWLFVLNQWDMGQPAQYEDFKKQLAKAGFNNPLVFRSSCSQQTDDEFIPLLDSIRSLATEHSLELLQQHALQTRKRQLQQDLQQCLPLLDGEDGFRELKKDWQESWQQTETLLRDAFVWPMRQHAAKYAEKESQLLPLNNQMFLWDDWAQNRFDDMLDELILKADQLKLPSPPLRESLHPMREKAGEEVDAHAESGCRKALANPGNVLHRAFLKFSRFCEIVLPLLAMGFVAYQLLIGFYQGAQDKQEYLGMDFAVHSVLLVAISWLLPYFVHKKMQPSIEKAALKGLKNGLDGACFRLADEIARTLEATQQQQQQFLGELHENIDLCKVDHADIIENDSLLKQVLPE